MERAAVYGINNWAATMSTTYRASGVAEHMVEVTGSPPERGLGSFGADQDTSAVGLVNSSQWTALVTDVASSGLFRFQGEAATAFATHHEIASITVVRSDMPDCTLISLAVLKDEEHESFQAPLDILDDLEARVDWREHDAVGR